MNPREQLRKYLEQRRELGEQELVLDRLAVDDVLKMVGALGAGGSEGATSGRSEEGGRNPGGTVSSDVEASVPAAVSQREPSDDPGSRAPSGPLGDWREMLRAAGGAPPGVSKPVAQAGKESSDEPGEVDEMKRRSPAKAAELAGSDQASGSEPAVATPRGARKATTGESAASGPGKAETSVAASDAETAVLPPWVAAHGIPPGLAVGMSAALDETFARLSSLEELAASVEKCTRCALYRTASHAVPGDGNPDADLVCVGEAPGANEDATGHAFVGTAGQLLTKILAAINLSREDVFICNVLKHRPPANRNPAPDEVEACSPYLLRQLELVKPKVILTLGAFAAQTLLQTRTPMGKLRGQVHMFHGIPLVVTYHPAALLRNSAWKRPTWEDVQFARRLLDSAPRSGA